MADAVLAAAASQLDLSLSPPQLERLSLYADRVMAAPFDLVGYKTRQELLGRGICDALAVFSRLGRLGPFVDVGSGAGLPGLVFGLLGAAGCLIEARRKKSDFLSRTAKEWDLPVEVMEARAEEVAQGALRETYGLAMSRAVGPLALVLELTAPFVEKGGTVAALKGPRAQGERAAGERAAKALGLSPLCFEPYAIPGAEPGGWVLVRATKIRKTPAGYPRSGAKLGQW